MSNENSWPTDEQGHRKLYAQLTKEEKRRVINAAIRRLEDDLSNGRAIDSIEENIIAVLAARNDFGD